MYTKQFHRIGPDNAMLNPQKNGKEAPIWGVAQFGEMSYPGS